VHALFADGSWWSEVIARLQAAGLNLTAVQNPLTTLDAAVASTQRVLAQQDGPTVLLGHSIVGMIVIEAEPVMKPASTPAGKANNRRSFPACPCVRGESEPFERLVNL
jgi:hypothetical protein